MLHTSQNNQVGERHLLPKMQITNSKKSWKLQTRTQTLQMQNLRKHIQRQAFNPLLSLSRFEGIANLNVWKELSILSLVFKYH